MPEDRKKIAIGAGVVLGALAAIYFATRAKAAPPPPPPPPGKANLYGTVVDAETGSEIPGVLVTLDTMQVSTDANGNYAFTNLEPGDYFIIFEKEGYEMVSGDITLHEGDNPLNVAMVPVAPPPELARLFGIVTDADTGLALGGVSVGLWPPDESELLLHEFTDGSGYYSMENILPGSYVVIFTRDGYETVRR